MRLSLSAFPISVQQVTVPAIVLIISLVAFIFDSSFSDLFVYQRSLVTQGEVWRVFTGHFFHTNGAHFLLNSAAVIMISAVICAVGIHWFSPNIEQYVGLSGILHGLFIWGAIEDIKAKERTGYLLLIGVILKIAHEQYYGASEDVADLIGANVAINAHLWGALGGVFAILFLMALKLFPLKKH
jgi:membrane associated rhomboid family serine protease